MSNLSDFYKTKVAGMLFGETYSVPATLHLALHTDNPTSGGGNEVSGGGYARVAFAPASVMSAASGGQKTNSSAITFPIASASWGTVSYWSIKTASSGGETLMYGNVTPKAISALDTMSVPIGSMLATVA